jgi:hypothetical protein
MMSRGRILVIAGSDSSGGACVTRFPSKPTFYTTTNNLIAVALKQTKRSLQHMDVMQ